MTDSTTIAGDSVTADIDPLLNSVDLDAVGSLARTVSDNPDAGHTIWRARVQWDGGFRSHAQVRGFDAIASDEPPALGGTDSAPNPVEQLLAALGNCLAVGYAANASARGFELRDLRVDIRGDLDLHVFLGLRPGHAGFDRISVEVLIDADATAEELAELHDAVTSTSPVGHTLSSAVPVEFRLAR